MTTTTTTMSSPPAVETNSPASFLRGLGFASSGDSRWTLPLLDVDKIEIWETADGLWKWATKARAGWVSLRYVGDAVEMAFDAVNERRTR
ncbi:hypothetical protein HN937_16980 [Candidatus Poribacteria bacterium]|jgi:hypothetical protein|nr:hypothetical protein [Candidatus Poribacteria bacterium]